MLRNLMLAGAVIATAAIAVPMIHENNPDLLTGLAGKATGAGAVEEPPTVAMLETERAPSGRRVQLESDTRGHFIGDFRINGRTVEAMIDTGASVVAINMSTARRIGVSVAPADFRQEVNTANGVIKAAATTLDRLEIGGIVVRNVDAVVLGDSALSGTLVGMSFLNGLKRYQVENGRLLLEQ